MSDRLRRGDYTGEVWDEELFFLMIPRVPSFRLVYERAGVSLDVRRAAFAQLQEEFRADQ